MKPILALLCALAAAPLHAETPLDAESFEALVEGRTLTFEIAGEPYGIERYMEGRRVIWSFLDGQCTQGEWYQQGEAICFVYDRAPDDPQCWEIYDEGERLRTVFLSGEQRSTLYEARPGDEELVCNNFGF
ncbi:hypothetical protein [Histidinibacterium aquaticum]|uniref:Dihydrodipicolinate reductase n=1 Tax=Histidinibacterium aquaticum TaxID=2613962 RepID=A0A5J5GQ79_9RHOB|nr:hypothetical protein [Histidinibacterium aquaticum]KAA9010225.1 hypothetical protein F3S47_02960 [Histidinibacterium aquaticum]